jgi:hypothetical protein
MWPDKIGKRSAKRQPFILQEGIMAETGFPHRPGQLDRRRFLTAAAATTAAFGPVAAPRAEPVEVVRAGPRQRPEGDIEAWDVGLMVNQRRPGLTAAQNRGRMGELRTDVGNRFGLYQVRGRYVPTPGAEPIEEWEWVVSMIHRRNRSPT